MCRTLGFTALYVLATYAGRKTVMDPTSLSLVWPAAGVLAVWFVAQRASRWRALDVAALIAVTVTVDMLTGAPAVLSGFFVVANLVQGFRFVYLFDRWLPGVRQSGRPGHVRGVDAPGDTPCGAPGPDASTESRSRVRPGPDVPAVRVRQAGVTRASGGTV